MLKLIREYSLPLIVGVCTALVWANVEPVSYGHVVHYLHFAVNDIFMVFFFAIAAGEIVESCLPGGPLNPPRKAINPLIATIGGVVGPVAVFLGWAYMTNDPAIAGGWGIPTATDIALAWLVARAVFGKGHPAVSFLLLLAIADDAIGLGIIAIFYPDPAHPVQPMYLGLVAAGMALAYLFRIRGVRSFWPYVLAAGALSWAGLFAAGVHPALALVFIVPFMPHADHDEGLFAEREYSAPDTLNRFQHSFELPVDLGLFAFGLANAGVVFGAVGNATWAVLAALVVGKTVGIAGMALLGHALGFKLPDGVGIGAVTIVGLIAGIGLTVALFVAGVAYTDPGLVAAAKMGALLSVVAAPAAILLGRLRKRAPAAEAQAGAAAPAPVPSAPELN